MIFRSQSGVMENTSSTLSSISRCWAVTQHSDSISGLAASSFTSGAILMASGRVPNTLMIRSLLMLLFLCFPACLFSCSLSMVVVEMVLMVVLVVRPDTPHSHHTAEHKGQDEQGRLSSRGGS